MEAGFPETDTPTDTTRYFENVDRVRTMRRAAMFFLRTPTGTYRRSFRLLLAVLMVKIFLSMNQMKFTMPAE